MTWLQLVMFWIYETEKNLFPGAWEGFFKGVGGGGNRKKKKKKIGKRDSPVPRCLSRDLTE